MLNDFVDSLSFVKSALYITYRIEDRLPILHEFKHEPNVPLILDAFMKPAYGSRNVILAHYVTIDERLLAANVDLAPIVEGLLLLLGDLLYREALLRRYLLCQVNDCRAAATQHFYLSIASWESVASELLLLLHCQLQRFVGFLLLPVNVFGDYFYGLELVLRERGVALAGRECLYLFCAWRH